jgi:pantoate--beta-alanine ligase
VIVVYNSEQLRKEISKHSESTPEKSIGLVPTMGALHAGHMSLIDMAVNNCNTVICSIFVNPTQFNDPSDLAKYPRTIEADIDLLQKHGCDILFCPDVEVIYPKQDEKYIIDFDGLDEVMEGKYRENHFNGVARVVERFFDIVKPDKAYFGRKDFQQLAIIKRMVRIREIDIEIVAVPTVRSSEGLALSSRNQLLTESQLSEALIIYKTLQAGVDWVKIGESTSELRNKLVTFFQQGNLKLEYLELVDSQTLESLDRINKNTSCCIAAYCGDVRLIDNIELTPSE